MRQTRSDDAVIRNPRNCAESVHSMRELPQMPLTLTRLSYLEGLMLYSQY
jgi:hypothetical protein